MSSEIAKTDEIMINSRLIDDKNFQVAKNEASFDKQVSERIVSLDFQRGIAIWLVTFLHCFERLYDYSWVKQDPKDVVNLPIPVLVIGLTVGFFACWNAYFLLISSTVNAYSMAKKSVQKKFKIHKLLIKQLLTGVGLIIVGMFTVGFGLYGYFDVGVRYGEWTNFEIIYRNQFRMSTLHMIGYSLIINSIIQYFLMRNDGHRKYKRNMTIYGILALAVIISSTFIHNWVDNLPWNIPENPPLNLHDSKTWPNEYFQGYNASFKTYILAILAGDMEPLFPYLATGFIGSMIGLTLARPKPVKRLPLKGGIIAITLMALGGMFIALGFFRPSNGRPALGNYLLMLGGEIGAIMLFLGLVEYRGRSQRFADRGIVRHFRVWGMVSLSLFALGIIEIVPKIILSKVISYLFTPIDLVQTSVFSYGQEYMAILVSIYVIFFFELMISLWSRCNFKYSFEWGIVQISSLSSKIKSQRLDVDVLLNYSRWVDYKQLLQANTVESTIDEDTKAKLLLPPLKVK